VQSGDEIVGQLEGMVFGDESASMANMYKNKKKREREREEETEEGRSID
jgi:hypothetical protein